MREYHVRICERLGVRFPGPTRQLSHHRWHGGMRDGLTERRLDKLAETVSVDRRTVARWRGWWLGGFTTTPFWRAASGSFMPPVAPARLPAALLERFAGDAAEQLIAFLSFLGPITGGASMRAF